jgi:outer membrane receptor protein involved in Fe transport
LEEKTEALDQVEVIGERIKGVETVDRTIYTIPESAVKVAGSGTDILRRIPSVQVDISNNISLQGNTNILILIDGKERDKNFIAQLDPKSIDKVEVITNPSSKYDAGVRGVINVILKKESREGINGSADLEIPTSSDHYISSSYASIDYGTGKLRIFSSVNSHFEAFGNIKDLSRESGTTLYLAKGNGRFSFGMAVIHYGFDYFINDKNTFNFYANYNPTQFNMDYNLQNKMTDNGSVTNSFTTDSKSHDSRGGQFYSVFYKKEMDKTGHQITLDMSYYDYKATTTNSYIEQPYLPDFSAPSGQLSTRSEILMPTRQSVNTKIDYTLPINDKFSFEAGAQNYLQFIKDQYDYSNSVSSFFNYKEIRYALYSRLNTKFKKVSFQAGFRAEYSDIYISDTKTTDYFFLLPNASVQYSFENQQSLKLLFTRSIDRPGSGDLNPSVTVLDAYNVSHGNPKLDPSFTNRIQLTYSKNIKSSFISPELYYDHRGDVFQRVIKVNVQNVSESYIDNLGTADEFGLGLSASIKVNKWLMINPYFRGFYSHSNSFVNADFNIDAKEDFGWMGNIYATATLTKGLNLWCYATYASPVTSMQSTHYRDALYLIGLEKSIWKDKGKIGINWYEPFKSDFRFSRNVTKSPGLIQDDDNFVKLRTLISLKFTYRFNKGKEVKKLERQKSLESDGKGGLG